MKAKHVIPATVDQHVGSRVHLRRNLLGWSQEKLGNALGLTFQQVQKYERGANRIAASRLFDLSRVLDVPISFFFDDMPAALGGTQPGIVTGNGDTAVSRETIELARAFQNIPDPGIRAAMRTLMRATTSAASDLPKVTPTLAKAA
jgi:transcriptional regulator with XRE-family HTH domain